MAPMKLWSLFAFVLQHVAVEAVILQPIRPHEQTHGASSIGRRAVPNSDLDLRNEEILLWGDDGRISRLLSYRK